MVRVTSFVLCDSINPLPIQQGHRSILTAQINSPLQVLRPFSIPGMFSFSLMLSVSGFKLAEGHSINIDIISPEDNVIFTVPVDTSEVPEEKMNLPIEAQGVVVNVDVRNLVFKTEGLYKFRIQFDGEEISTYEIYVYKAF